MADEKQITIKIKDKMWTVRLVKSKDMPRSYGECDDPSVSKPEIWINRNLKQKDMLDTIIHEVLHATHPELSEESVGDTATIVANVLYKLGVRFAK
jgi:hypothetical protein